MSQPPRPVVPALMALLIASVALAGCMGDGDKAPKRTETPDEDPLPLIPEDEIDWSDENTPKPVTENVPEAHYHHYWGNPALPKVTIFDGPVELTLDHCFTSDSETDTGCIGPEPHMGLVKFDLETDGDDVTENSRDPLGAEAHADVVFTGTSHIEATFTWTDTTLGNDLLLYYRPANSPIFLPQDGGIRVNKDDPRVVIPLKAGMADPAHQFRVSRWAFILVADGGPADPWTGPIYYGTGEVNVFMEAINGGKNSVDPPHPDHWKGRDVVPLGKLAGSFSVSGAHAEAGEVTQTAVTGDDFQDIPLPLRSVIPTGSEKLVVRAFVNATDTTPEGLDWGLKYHGANTQVYTTVPTYESSDGARVFTIPISDFEVDPPYETESFFRLGFYPVLGGQQQSGTFAGEYTLFVEVHKQPDFTYYF